MKEQLKINVASENGEIIIRHGEALTQKPYNEITVHGTLDAPGAFLSARIETLEAQTSYLEVDRDAGSLRFVMHTENNDRNQVFGRLTSSKAIRDFGINEAKTYSSKELAKFFRKNAFYFSDKDSHTEIIKALMKFEATVTTIIEDTSDNRGNIKKLLDKKVSTEVPEAFIMKAPIFLGYESIEFEVLIGAEASNTDVKFFLESPELFLLSDQEKGKLIADEIKAFEEFGCAILYLS